MIRRTRPLLVLSATAALGLLATACDVETAGLDGGEPPVMPPVMTIDEVAAAPIPPELFIDPAGATWRRVDEAVGDIADAIADADEAPMLELQLAAGYRYVLHASAPEPALNELEPSQIAMVPQLINGSDDRRRIMPGATRRYPYSAVVHLTNDVNCSGAMFGPRHVLTAGHCVHEGSRRGDHYGTTTVTPGRACSSGTDCRPFGTAREVARIVAPSWMKGIRRRWNDDWAIIILDRDIGNDTGWLGWRGPSSDELDELRVTTYGYPGDKPYGQMWGMSCGVNIVLPQKFRYECDTAGGQSGSGIWDPRHYLVGVLSNHGLLANRAVRLRAEITNAMSTARRAHP